MTVDVTVCDPWTVISEVEGNLTEPGEYLAVEHPNGLLGTVQVEEGRYDATDVFATIVDETQDEDENTLESLWLSNDDFEGNTEVARDEVVDEFEHWLEQYKDWE